MTRRRKLAKLDSDKTSLTRAELQEFARRGHCATSLVASARDLVAFDDGVLPEGKYCFVEDVVAALRQTADALLKVDPHRGTSFVMAERGVAQDLVLSLVSANTKVGNIPDWISDPQFDPKISIAAEQKRLVSTHRAVRELLGKATSGSLSIEAFDTALEGMEDPDLAKRLLQAMNPKGPSIHTRAGLVDLEAPERMVKDLPSEARHIVLADVVRGFDDLSRIATVVTRQVIDGNSTLFELGNTFRVHATEEHERVMLLISQALKRPVQLTVALHRVPLQADRRSDLVGDLVQISWDEGSAQLDLRRLLGEQLSLNLLHAE